MDGSMYFMLHFIGMEMYIKKIYEQFFVVPLEGAILSQSLVYFDAGLYLLCCIWLNLT